MKWRSEGKKEDKLNFGHFVFEEFVGNPSEDTSWAVTYES